MFTVQRQSNVVSYRVFLADMLWKLGPTVTFLVRVICFSWSYVFISLLPENVSTRLYCIWLELYFFPQYSITTIYVHAHVYNIQYHMTRLAIKPVRILIFTFKVNTGFAFVWIVLLQSKASANSNTKTEFLLRKLWMQNVLSTLQWPAHRKTKA